MKSLTTYCVAAAISAVSVEALAVEQIFNFTSAVSIENSICKCSHPPTIDREFFKAL